MNMSCKNLYDKFSLYKVFVPKPILHSTEGYLRKHGSLCQEGMVLWSGVKTRGNIGIIKSCIHPQQYCTAASFDVPLDESQRINRLLEQKGESIIAQVHSHPGQAFHSDTDDRFPVTFTVGLFSIVVPWFCGQRLTNISQCKVWEHVGVGRWRELKTKDIKERFIITDRKEENNEH